MADLDALQAELSGLKLETHPSLVKQKSRDFFWYSPVLKRRLDDVTGDLVVTPSSEDDVARVLAACYRHDVPVTVRGAGTGNYGQAMPLAGGVILNMAEMTAIRSIEPGVVVCEPGAIMADIDRRARTETGQELRLHPSTHRTASIGGFVAGGSGGVGSVRWGGLRDLGNIVRLKVLTMEAEPRVIELAGEDIHKVNHAYGTNGVITEVTMPLTAAYEWVDVVVGFDALSSAAAFADMVANQDGILTKEIAVVAAPAAHDYFLRHQRFIGREQHVVVLMVAPFAMDALAGLVDRSKGTLTYRSDVTVAGDGESVPPAYELCWNHTTLRALRVDPAITYLQILFPYPDHLTKVAAMADKFGDEVVTHLEFVRFDGNVACFGLPLVRFTSEERLDEIVSVFETAGCPVFNPHRYTLEEGGMKQTDPVQLAFKKETDPKGLLNPGKMIAWEDPSFDYSSHKTYLFPGLHRA
ncbi:FAD-binding oxidoreductase [Amorphus orientalis]|uniref:FAD/FMN-containing dehydrogenase n=1 Tax=Amorphus orientalis TaxID=649198 RepID=A0AAE4AR80_9HYPH|nr:FAD-binding oxidoreductase [Amorphus orientalis]MDQ0313902.1 FAD/FMN-containing dehydrogenase [Amorphus orientalis]